MKIFDTCIRNIFVYNAELWTLSEKLKKKIDGFHRKLLQKMPNIRWPTKKKFKRKLQQKSQQRPRTSFIAEQRLQWLGHAIRLQENSAAKKALEEAERYLERPQ